MSLPKPYYEESGIVIYNAVNYDGCVVEYDAWHYTQMRLLDDTGREKRGRISPSYHLDRNRDTSKRKNTLGRGFAPDPITSRGKVMTYHPRPGGRVRSKDTPRLDHALSAAQRNPNVTTSTETPSITSRRTLRLSAESATCDGTAGLRLSLNWQDKTWLRWSKLPQDLDRQKQNAPKVTRIAGQTCTSIQRGQDVAVNA